MKFTQHQDQEGAKLCKIAAARSSIISRRILERHWTRRTFLMACGGSLVAACGPASAPQAVVTAPPATAAPKPTAVPTVVTTTAPAVTRAAGPTSAPATAGG